MVPLGVRAKRRWLNSSAEEGTCYALVSVFSASLQTAASLRPKAGEPQPLSIEVIVSCAPLRHLTCRYHAETHIITNLHCLD